MSDIDAGVALTPEETAFFDSGGAKSPEKPQESEVKAEPEKSEEAKEKVSGEEQTQDTKPEKVVPLAALHEERGKRKGLEQRLRDIELENARYSERFKLVEQQQTKAPDPSEDPLAYIQQQIPKELDEVNKKLSAYEKREQQQAAHQQLVAQYSQDADRFRTHTADFDQAYKYAVESRVREYQLIGHPNPVAAAQNDEMQIALHAYQIGKNPAEVIYDIAKSRGYQTPKPDKQAAEKLAQIEKGQAANKSLASAGGTSGAEEMTAKQLLEMPMDEFESWVNKNPAKAKRLMGG